MRDIAGSPRHSPLTDPSKIFPNRMIKGANDPRRGDTKYFSVGFLFPSCSDSSLSSLFCLFIYLLILDYLLMYLLISSVLFFLLFCSVILIFKIFFLIFALGSFFPFFVGPIFFVLFSSSFFYLFCYCFHFSNFCHTFRPLLR